MRAKTFGALPSARRVCVIGLILVSLLSCAAFADRAITRLDVTNEPDRVVVSVQANCPLSMTPLASARGSCVGFQFPVKLATQGRIVGVHSGDIWNVKYSNFRNRPAATRIVVNTSSHRDYSTEWSEDKTRLEISVWKKSASPAAMSASATHPLVDDSFQPVATKAPQPVAEKPAEPVELAAAALAPAKETPAPVMAAVTEMPAAKPVVPEKVELPPMAVAPAVERMAKGSDAGYDVKPAAKLSTRTERVSLAAPVVAVQPPATAGKMVSLNFLGAEVQDVLKALSVQSGENIVASKDVQGKVTVSLTDVSVEHALDYVAKLSGYGYMRQNNTYLVGSRDSLNAMADKGSTNSTVQVVALNYAKSDDVLALLKSNAPSVQVTKSAQSDSGKDGSKTLGSPNGILVLAGTENDVTDARNLIAQIEESMKSQTVGESTEIYQLRYVSAQEMIGTLKALIPEVTIAPAPSDGFDLHAPQAVTVGSGDSAAGGTTVEHMKSTKAPDELGWVRRIVISGSEPAVKRAMELAARMDVKSPQVKFEAKVTSLTEEGEKQLGLSWNWSEFGWLEGFAKPSDPGNVPVSQKRWFRQPFDFGATLDALIKDGNGKLLAAPSLVCVEGKPGIFFVGDEVRYIILVQQTPQGANVTTETANVGVQLRVVADVSPDGYITMNLHPEVSLVQLDKDQATGITLPIIKRRFTDHVVRVKNGETIIIGGLIRDDEIESMSKIPLLGDLPFLGKLFRHRSTSKSHSEVVMFITASIIED